jgi:hypothetical protein
MGLLYLLPFLYCTKEFHKNVLEYEAFIIEIVYSFEGSKIHSFVFVLTKINVSARYKEILPVISHSGR